MYRTILVWALSMLVTCFGGNHSAQAFGQNGHRIVAQIAENELDKRTRRKLKAISGVDSLAELSTWPDFVRSDPSWYLASPWHYMSLADEQSFADYKAPPQGDILTALVQFEAVLRDPKAKQTALRQALAFYVHLVGDLHQPLHVGRAEDRGGNDIEVLWFGERSNLHRVWDTDLIDQRKLSFTEYVNFLAFDKDTPLAQWRCGSYRDWAAESKALRAQVYNFGPQRDEETPSLSYNYIFTNRAALDQRLQQAGVRLAAMLEAIFSNKSLPQQCPRKS